MSLYRKSSGLILDDEFIDDTGGWTFSPTTACQVDHAGGLLKMSHSDVGTIALINLPTSENQIAFQVTASYVPMVEGDEGGIVVWQDSVNKLEFLESLDNREGEYFLWRAVKSGNFWKFYAKRGLAWEFFDSAPLNASMIGIVLKGASQTNFVNLDVDRVIMCRGTSIQVGNIKQGWRVDLINRFDNLVSSHTAPQTYSGLEVPLPDLPFVGKIQIFDENGIMVDSTEEMSFFGGDQLLYGTDLELLWNGVELSRFNDTYLGNLYDNQILQQLVVRNPTEYTAFNVQVAVEQYQTKFGYEWVDVALDNGGEPGEYGDVIVIGDLLPGETKPFWVRFLKSEDKFTLEPAKFILDVSHT